MPGTWWWKTVPSSSGKCGSVRGLVMTSPGFSEPEIEVRACKSGAIRFDEAMFPRVALTQDKTWQPGPYEGVELMLLHQHEPTGGVVVLRKFKAGHTIPAHTHPKANEWAYVLSGEWEESGKTYAAGTLFFAPKGI